MAKAGRPLWYAFHNDPAETLLKVSQGQNQILTQIQNAGLIQSPHERRRDHRDSDRRRASQIGGIVPPSPALVRHGSKQRKVPTALLPGGGSPGQLTPHSAAAQVNVPVGTPQHRGTPQHPYANVPTGFDYTRDMGDEPYGVQQQQQYGRASPMVSSVGAAPPALSNVRARGGDVGVSQGGDYNGQEDARPKTSLLRILTCRCG